MPALLGPSLCLGCLNPSCFEHWWFPKRLSINMLSETGSLFKCEWHSRKDLPKARLVSKRAVCICLCCVCIGRFNIFPYLYTSHSRFFLIDSCIVEITLKEEPFLFTHRTYIWTEPKFPIKPTHPTSMRFSEKKHPSAKAFASAILAIFAVSLDWWSETPGKGRGFWNWKGGLWPGFRMMLPHLCFWWIRVDSCNMSKNNLTNGHFGTWSYSGKKQLLPCSLGEEYTREKWFYIF